MIHLMRLELRKNKITKYLLLSVCLILFSILFITISMLDSAADPTQSKDTFENIFLMINVLLSFVFIVFYSVLVSSLVIKEYSTKTILIMFSYPINRKKLIRAKLLVISIFIALSMLFGYVLCCSYIVSVDYFFDLLGGDFEVSLLTNWIMIMTTTILICICIGLLTFGAGMIKKSVSFTIVSSIIFIFIMQVALSFSEIDTYDYSENLIQSLSIVIFTMLCMWFTFNYNISKID